MSELRPFEPPHEVEPPALKATGRAGRVEPEPRRGRAAEVEPVPPSRSSPSRSSRRHLVEVATPAEDPVVRSVETVSAIDLVMGDDEQDPDPASPTPSSRTPIARVAKLAGPGRAGGPRYSFMATIGTPEHPLRVAIVGSGPSGFYAAGAPAQLEVASRPQRRGGRVRPAAHAVGTRARRGGARPPQHQGRLARLREDRRQPGLSLLRQRRAGPRPLPRRPDRPLPRGDLRGRGRRPTGAWASRARTCRAAGRPPSSWPGTTATPTTATSSSTCRQSARWWWATATWPPTWPGCSP